MAVAELVDAFERYQHLGEAKVYDPVFGEGEGRAGSDSACHTMNSLKGELLHELTC